MFLITLYDQDCCLVISITEALIKECYSFDWGISSIKIGFWGWLNSSSCWLNPNLFQLWKRQKTSASLRPRSIEQFLIQISAFFFSYKHESVITTKTKRTICERRDPLSISCKRNDVLVESLTAQHHLEYSSNLQNNKLQVMVT